MQTWILKDYPAELMVTTICCSFVVILSAIVALVAEQNPKAWILRPDMELIAIFYSVSIELYKYRKASQYSLVGL